MDSSVHHLLLSLGIFLGENPWSTVLVIRVALTRIVHSKLKRILELDFLHQGHVLVEQIDEGLDECCVSLMFLSFILGNDTIE